MSLNNYCATLKFRLSLAYVITTLVIVVSGFTSIFLYQRFIQRREASRQMEFLLDELEFEYLTGEEETLGAIRLPTTSCLATDWGSLRPLYVLQTPRQMILVGQEPNTQQIIERRYHEGYWSERIPQHHAVEFLREIIERESHGEAADQLLLGLLTPKHTLIFRSPFNDKYLHEFMSRDKSRNLLKISRTLYDGNTLTIAYNLHTINKNLRRLGFQFLILTLLIVTAGTLISVFLAKHFTHGLERVARIANIIEHGDFSQRVDHRNEGAEVDALIDAFNSMSQSTETLMKELKTITDDVAHDLRTPLTRLLGKAEIALTEPSGTLPNDVAEECATMLAIINTMLEISHTNKCLLPAQTDTIELCQLLQEFKMLYAPLLEDRHLTLNLLLPDTPVQFQAHRTKIQRLFANLLDNAIKFTEDNGVITLTLEASHTAIYCTIEDTGCGISAEALPHIFERFYRADNSRSKEGNGLGLALAYSIMKAYGGTISVRSTLGKGTCFTLVFPIHILT